MGTVRATAALQTPTQFFPNATFASTQFAHKKLRFRLSNSIQEVFMKFAVVCTLVSTAIIAGCSSAPKANEVAAAYVPVSRYENMNCEQLLNEAEAVRRSVPALAEAVDKHRSQQTGVEVVTWVLFWPAAFLLDKGEANSSKLAQARGELESIQLSMRNKKCGS
jgi:outer membrane murein-binding lipoprotein Lpp